jgi:hypothetical protein
LTISYLEKAYAIIGTKVSWLVVPANPSSLEKLFATIPLILRVYGLEGYAGGAGVVGFFNNFLHKKRKIC